MNKYKYLKHLIAHCYYPPRNFYVRKNPINIEWKIINHPFLGLTSSSIRLEIYNIFFCESFNAYTLRRSFDSETNFYRVETVKRALRSLRSKNICIKISHDDRMFTLYQFKNPIESNIYDNIEKTAFKF